MSQNAGDVPNYFEMNFLSSFKELQSMTFKKENIFYFLLIITIFSLDRISKTKVVNEFNDRVYFINDFLNIDLIWNIGIGFGLLSTDTSIFYNAVTFLIAIVIFVLFYLLIKSKTMEKFTYTIIIGGALGNFYDRLNFSAVPDFIDFHYKNFHWFTFNVADIFITIGILIFFIQSFFIKN